MRLSISGLVDSLGRPVGGNGNGQAAGVVISVLL
jgi:hypothetical protein